MDGGHSVTKADAGVESVGGIKPVSLFISVCSGRGWAGQFGYSLASLMLAIGYGMGDTRARVEQGLDGRYPVTKVNLVFSRQANIVASRNEHIMMAQAEGYTHFLSLDDDMTFPSNALNRMLEAGKPVIVANYRKKTADKIECVCSGNDGLSLDSTGRTGLEPVLSFGMGLTLIDLACLADIPPPFFAVVWNKSHNAFMIEDAVFASILREHKVEVWVDHDLSQEIGHIGDYEYRLPPVTI